MGKKDTPSEATQGDPADQIIVLGMERSPFSTKLETMLRIVGLPYEGEEANPQQAPKKKLPILRHGEHVVSDTSFITEYLTNTYPNEMAAVATEDPTRCAIAHLAQRTLEEHYAWVMSYNNWQCDENWDEHAKHVFKGLPGFLWLVVPKMARKQVVNDIHSQGLGRHSHEDVLKRGKKDMAALSLLLGEKPFLTGDTPTEADCSLFGMLDSALQSPAGSPLISMLADYPNLIQFRDSIKAKYFDEEHPSKFVKK